MNQEQPKMSRLGRRDEMDRSFDLAYWRSRSPTERMAAVWEMTVFHHKLKQRDPDELRLDRSVGGLRSRAR